MKRFILDYYRRWSLVLAIGAAVQLIFGWWITVEPKAPIEFIAMAIPICVGEILVLCDLSRGVFRVVATLPLTASQIGRSWWLANVLIPAFILTALLFLGAGAALVYRPDQAFPLNRLSMASLFTVVWLGTMFCLFFPATRKFSNRWQTTFVALVAVVFTLWIVMRAISSFLDFLSTQDVSINSINFAIFLAGGGFMTFVGWFRALRFDPAGAGVQFGCPKNAAGAAGFRLARLPTAPHQPPEGYGGIPFLLRTTFINGLNVYFSGAILILILAWIEPGFPSFGSPSNVREWFNTNIPMITVLLTFILFWLRPSLMQLRFLRTLPISTAKLAVVIIASVILPAIAVGMLMAGIAGLFLGTPAALTFLKSCSLILAPIALCVFFTVWRGGGIQAYALFIVPMIAWALVISAWRNITLPLAGGGALAGVMLAWLLTYYALLRSRRAYRVQTDPLSGFPWIAGRC